MIKCMASEIGKHVVNKCLDKGIHINTQKLQKLLCLIQVDCIRHKKKIVFKEPIHIWDCGVVIEEVDEDFRSNLVEFKEKENPYILLLEREEESIDRIIRMYGELNSFELNELPDIQKIIRLAIRSASSKYPYVTYPILIGAFM